MWNPQTLGAWYETDNGRRTSEVVLHALQAVDGVPWQGRLKPLLLDVGYGAPYHALWPTAMVDTELPADLGINGHMECRYDRLLLAHALEDPAHDPLDLLTRCWQALRPDGVLVVLVPASFSLCRLGRGPFAAGRCFTKAKMEGLLLEAIFKPCNLIRTRAGVLVAVAGKQVSGTKALVASKPAGVLPVPALNRV